MSAKLNALVSDSYTDISQYRDQHFKVSFLFITSNEAVTVRWQPIESLWVGRYCFISVRRRSLQLTFIEVLREYLSSLFKCNSSRGYFCRSLHYLKTSQKYTHGVKGQTSQSTHLFRKHPRDVSCNYLIDKHSFNCSCNFFRKCYPCFRVTATNKRSYWSRAALYMLAISPFTPPRSRYEELPLSALHRTLKVWIVFVVSLCCHSNRPNRYRSCFLKVGMWNESSSVWIKSRRRPVASVSSSILYSMCLSLWHELDESVYSFEACQRARHVS